MKQRRHAVVKRSQAQLALAGGEPAFREAVHVGGPNTPGKRRFLRSVREIFHRNQLTNNGPLVQKLESDVASYLGVDHCVAVANGTVALEMTLKALELDGEVIVPAYTFIASAHAIAWSGLTPVFVDIDPDTHLIDADAVRRVITPRTSAILAVHLWGRSADSTALTELAEEFGLRLVFDAAHAFGSTNNGVRIGGAGNAEIFSFHATKFFNTFEGGAITTNDDALAQRLRLTRNFGFDGFDSVSSLGTNAKMHEISAAMGLANLQHLEEIMRINSRNRACYIQGLSGVPGVRVLPYDDAETNNNQYVVLEVLENSGRSRDDLVHALHAENVMARKYFWPACHRMAPYRDQPPSDGWSLPATEAVADRVIVLPTGMGVSVRDVAAICAIIRLSIDHARRIEE